tara:strand:- start:14135 stop:15244 length:1110 start_codon:yes stop_codon:yes gene_type:complete
MAHARPIHRWSPGSSSVTAQSGGSTLVPFAERLAPVAQDRVSSAADLVRELGGVLLEELIERPHGTDWRATRRRYDALLAPLRLAHGWRGPVARFLHAFDGVQHVAQIDGLAADPEELLAEEVGLWLGGVDESSLTDSAHGGGSQPWSGRPLGTGRRLPDRAGLARAAARTLGEGETILVPEGSETVVAALIQATANGASPTALLGEGGPELSGRRAARELARAGVRVRIVYDAGLPSRVSGADRIWLGTEAIGAQGFLARVGTRTILEEARRLEVPSSVLATTDKLVPGGELALPAWGERDDWLLWEDPPEGVRVEAQPFESVPNSSVDGFHSERGPETPAALALQALATDDRIPPLGSTAGPAGQRP